MKIVVAEDGFASRKKLEKLLESTPYKGYFACDGAEALELWRREKPDMVITDWMMPNMTGVELCKKIREEERGGYTYLILVTSRSSTEDLVEAMDSGADDFIAKPYVREELLVRIRAGARVMKDHSKDIVIFSMANLAESRDPETGFHLERVRHFCKVLAERIGGMNLSGYEVSGDLVENIFLTSPLHDIGKIGIPDSILLKPGKLTPEEFKIMQKHSQIGFSTLNAAYEKYPRAGYLKVAGDIALCHHEKWDGSGYPYGLKRNDIPLSARITALADVYDALVSKRVYKDACKHEAAKEILLEGREKHFDPVVIEAFLQAENLFLEVARRFSE